MHDTNGMRSDGGRDDGARVADDSPPFGGSWRTLYVLVLAWLALLVVLFYLFTRAFR